MADTTNTYRNKDKAYPIPLHPAVVVYHPPTLLWLDCAILAFLIISNLIISDLILSLAYLSYIHLAYLSAY
ncbi:hypothetical protein B0H19DRAFT_1118937 [Mycena capillaripes]|nr:hypothetical protein B0H19DRAFT_1118937 [Mycena capillaripes]